MVLSFSLPGEADFSFLAEEEPDAARAAAAALVQGLAWLLASVEEERVCFEVAALAADALVAELAVADVAAAELVADATVVLAAGALVAEPVAGAAAAELEPACSALAVVLAADELAAELVVGVAVAALVADAAVVLAADELVAELVVGVAVAALVADELVAGPVAGAQVARCDWAAVEVGQELAVRRAVR